MEPDIEALLAELTKANEIMAQAFIKQLLAFNNMKRALEELQDDNPHLFNQKEDI